MLRREATSEDEQGDSLFIQPSDHNKETPNTGQRQEAGQKKTKEANGFSHQTDVAHRSGPPGLHKGGTPSRAAEEANSGVRPMACVLERLPPTLQMTVIAQLRVREVCQLALVCRAWLAWVSSDDFWHRFHAQRFDPIESAAAPSPFRASSRAQRAQRDNGATAKSAQRLLTASKWRDDFKRRFERARGWRRTNYQEVIMRGHQMAVTAVRMWGIKERLFSASADR